MGDSVKWLVLLLLCPMAYAQTTVSADFNSRSGGTVIPANSIETGISGLSASTPLVYFPLAGLNVGRLSVSIPQICVSGTCTYTIPDAQFDLLVAKGIKVLALVSGTPNDLGASTCTPPSNNTTWAGYVDGFITHELGRHANSIAGIEIWNEPDNTANWCPTPGTELTTFESFTGAVGPIIATANTGIPVGGPALGAPAANAATWIPGVIGAWSGIGFVSYHYYPGAQTTWASYLTEFQDASTGIGPTYATIQGLVTGASSSAPIWVTEWNNKFQFSVDCCRNDPTFAPLMVSTYELDFLNAHLSYGASTIPALNSYFTSQTNAAYFCVVGFVDTGKDCDSTTLPQQPYPQYFAFSLFNSALGLSAGGNMATSISPGSTTSGLQSTGFYTSAADSIVLVNPTSSDITNVTVQFLHPGSISSNAICYTLNANNAGITRSAIALSAITNGFGATITVPAYSTMAIQMGNVPSIPGLVPRGLVQ